jgi:hypothetical protein
LRRIWWGEAGGIRRRRRGWTGAFLADDNADSGTTNRRKQIGVGELLSAEHTDGNARAKELLRGRESPFEVPNRRFLGEPFGVHFAIGTRLVLKRKDGLRNAPIDIDIIGIVRSVRRRSFFKDLKHPLFVVIAEDRLLAPWEKILVHPSKSHLDSSEVSCAIRKLDAGSIWENAIDAGQAASTDTSVAGIDCGNLSSALLRAGSGRQVDHAARFGPV